MIVLSSLKDDHATRFEAMIDEYREHNDVGIYTGFYDAAWHGFHAYRAMLEKLSLGGWPFSEVVPGETLFIMDRDEIVGEVYLRFALVGPLYNDGGNLGFQIRPSARNKGYGTAGARLALERLKAIGLTQALLTVSETNAASIRVIEKLGAVRIDDAQLADRTSNRRYLVHLDSVD